jgi:hypothetical protein
MEAASTPDRKRAFRSSMTEHKNSKMTPGAKGRKAGVRVIELSNWKEDNDGCYRMADIAGTDFPCNQKSPLLEPNNLKLCDTGDLKFYEFSWSARHKKHVGRTI